MLTYILRTEADHGRIATLGHAENFYQLQCTRKCPWSIRSRNWNILLYYKRFIIDQTMPQEKSKHWRNLWGKGVSLTESSTMLPPRIRNFFPRSLAAPNTSQAQFALRDAPSVGTRQKTPSTRHKALDRDQRRLPHG